MFIISFKLNIKVIKMNLSEHDHLLIDILEVMVRKRKFIVSNKKHIDEIWGNQYKEKIGNSVSSWTTYRIKYLS